MIPAVLLGYNLAVALVYGFDKRRAQAGGRRVPERRLLVLAVLLGSAGAWVGMRLFRHKTRKPMFRFGVPALLLLQLAVAGALSEPGRGLLAEAMGVR